jgi:drug/metabolite transporter (DMT)-like permease
MRAMANLFGPLLILFFCLSQAFRDVYFGHVFQGIDFFSIILLAFLLSTLIFGAIAMVRARAEFARLRGHWPTVLAMNVTTAIAWCCYFFALTHLEPSIVSTIHSGMAPLVVIALGVFGGQLARHNRIGPMEATAYAGIALSLMGLWWVVLSGRSGIPVADPTVTLTALALLLVSGTSITLSLLYSKRLHDEGFASDTVSAVRYPLIILVAACVELDRGLPQDFGGAGDLAFLAIAATLLIVLPLFALQAGIARTAPLTAQTIRALGPVFVFALEQFDGRIRYSAPVLVCILTYSAFCVLGNVAHGWRGEVKAAPARA